MHKDVSEAKPMDSSGREIKVGDVVEHIYGPLPGDPKKITLEVGAVEQMRQRGDPALMSDGFVGRRTVQELRSAVVIVDRIDFRIPVYHGRFLRVVGPTS